MSIPGAGVFCLSPAVVGMPGSDPGHHPNQNHQSQVSSRLPPPSTNPTSPSLLINHITHHTTIHTLGDWSVWEKGWRLLCYPFSCFQMNTFFGSIKHRETNFAKIFPDHENLLPSAIIKICTWIVKMINCHNVLFSWSSITHSKVFLLQVLCNPWQGGAGEVKWCLLCLPLINTKPMKTIVTIDLQYKII